MIMIEAKKSNVFMTLLRTASLTVLSTTVKSARPIWTVMEGGERVRFTNLPAVV